MTKFGPCALCNLAGPITRGICGIFGKKLRPALIKAAAALRTALRKKPAAVSACNFFATDGNFAVLTSCPPDGIGGQNVRPGKSNLVAGNLPPLGATTTKEIAMTRRFLFVSTLALACIASSAVGIAPGVRAEADNLAAGGSATGLNKAMPGLVEGNNEFGLDLYARLAQKPGNLFLSPYSISTALAMTYEGAKGTTAAEMKKVLHFPVGPGELGPTYADLISQLQDQKTKAKYNLVIANRLYGQKDLVFLPSFLKIQRDLYGAPLEQVDFIRATEAARQAINAWVEKQTKDKIKELIKPGLVTPNTRLVLANAIYFKSAWLQPFDANLTAAEQFFVGPNSAVKAPTMHAGLHTKFLKTDSFRALELPYQERELSMVLFLPNKVDGLADFEKQLNAVNLRQWLGKLTDHQVQVSLPKFKLTAEFELADTLRKLGMRDAFGPGADFSGMTTRDWLYISAVVHKAFIDLNEAGTEAAAATAVIMDRASAAPGDDFKADHPFVYLIKDNRTGAILFMGRVVNPT
jgi:serpin B